MGLSSCDYFPVPIYFLNNLIFLHWKNFQWVEENELVLELFDGRRPGTVTGLNSEFIKR
jgi:hypothetical protein